MQNHFPTPIKILTFNIHGWLTMEQKPNVERVAAVIRQTQADIIGLNEVFYPRTIDNGNSPALVDLAKTLGMHFVFGPCMRWPVQDNLPADAYGNALLSRWPIIASAAHHLTPKEEKLQQVVANKEPRGLLEGRILLSNNEPLTVYVTHLDHSDEAARLAQLRTMRTWTSRDRNRPHVVMGGFNAISLWDYAARQDALTALTRHPKAHHLVDGSMGPQVIAQMKKAGYTDAFTRYGTPGQASFIPATDHNLRIDYIFVNKPLAESVTLCQVVMEQTGEEASDHRPILAEIALFVQK